MGLNISIRPSGDTGNNKPHIVFSGLSTNIIWEMDSIVGLKIYPENASTNFLNVTGSVLEIASTTDLLDGLSGSL